MLCFALLMILNWSSLSHSPTHNDHQNQINQHTAHTHPQIYVVGHMRIQCVWCVGVCSQHAHAMSQWSTESESNVDATAKFDQFVYILYII